MTSLVLLSGWGIDSRIWRGLEPYWPAYAVITAPDWPGYGEREALSRPEDMSALAETMHDDLPASSVWVGWSLGALLAAALLDHLPAPRGLVMLGMGRRFADDGTGVSRQELVRFRQAFERAPHRAWRHFLRWQMRGEPSPRKAVSEALALFGERPCADDATLAAGLTQLAQLDVTRTLAHAPCPVSGVYGTRDPFLGSVPLMRKARVTLDGAGHCPQLSEPQRLALTLHALATAMAEPRQEMRDE